MLVDAYHYLFQAFGVYFLFFWLGLSYIAGWFLYAYALRLADRRARDNPLSSRWCHMIVGHQVAQTMMFVSLPFATSHSGKENDNICGIAMLYCCMCMHIVYVVCCMLHVSLGINI